MENLAPIGVALASRRRAHLAQIAGTMPSRKRASFWSDFRRSLTRRGLRGVQMVISDAHEGLKAAARKVMGAGWQRCREHFPEQLQPLVERIRADPKRRNTSRTGYPRTVI
jgi:transposase-like protein